MFLPPQAVVATSAHGRQVTLAFDAAPVTTATKAATLCADPGEPVTQAKLWMPGMGHGSAPTHLAALPGGCTRVEHLSFVMSGGWQLLVTFTDGDTATLAVAVQ